MMLQIKFKNCIKLFRVFIFAILFVNFYSCHKHDKADNTNNLTNENIPTDVNENQFTEIHKEIYINPSIAREKAFLILDSLGIDDKASKIKLLKNVGSSYVFETNYSEAIKYYNKALSLAEEIKLYLEIAHINNNLGVIYTEIGNYKNAYVHLVDALNFYDLSGNKDKKIGAINNIGLVFLNLNNNEKALYYFDDALNSHAQSKDTILVVSILNNIALCYINEKKPELAIDYIDKAIKLSEKINNQYSLCISYQLSGNIYLSLNNTDSAFNSYSKGIEIANKANLSYQLAASRLGIARVYLELNNTDEALKIAFDVMNLGENQNNLILIKDAHQIFSDIYNKTKDYKNSLIHFQKHTKVVQEIINQTVVNEVYDVESKYLNQVNKMQQLELEKKELVISKKNNLLFFISLVFILLLIGLYLVYLNHHHRQKVKLQKTIIELTEKKSNAALEAEIQERKRIGQELHDSLGHLLSLAGLHAGVLYNRKDITDEKRKEMLEFLMKIIEDAFEEVRNISHNLSPSLLSELGLKGALKNISDRVNHSNKLKMSFDIFGLDEKLDNLIEYTLFRTIQEIVNNTIKHANASNLFIQITKGNNEISLIAEDNGKGFNFDEVKKHSSYGLLNMKSRIENLKGTMFIDSTINRGTIISILIPIQ